MHKLFTLFILCSVSTLWGQDSHFSQYEQAPQRLNPALTGLQSHDIQGVLHYRSQWAAVTVPYQTYRLGLTWRKALAGEDLLGAGLEVYRDQAGSASFGTTSIGASLAFHKSLEGVSQYLSGGAQVAWAQRGVNYNQLTWDNQFTGLGFDPTQNSGELWQGSNFSYTDFSAGLLWAYRPSKQQQWHIGAAAYHLNQPAQHFLTSEGQLSMRFVLHAGATLGLTERTQLIPRLLYMQQGTANELQAGGMFRFELTDRYAAHRAFMGLGTYHRWQDAQVLLFQFEWSGLRLTWSYDVNFSSLRRASQGQGGTELSLGYRTMLQQQAPLGCPTW